MYSLSKNVQILVASLKAHGVRKVVHCPGGSDAPIGISLDTDSDFTCYSVVDERSALFFAMGLSMSNNLEPVAVVCTSGTAVSNLSSGMTEAFYKGVPVVAITADRSPYLLDQFEIQKIDQRSIFANCSKCEVDLPLVNNDEEFAYCDRLVNTALLEATSGAPGPVHINVPVCGRSGCFAHELPAVKVIKRHLPTDGDEVWRGLSGRLAECKRIMVIVGENCGIDDATKAAMDAFAERYNCMFSVEHMSNYDGENAIMTYRATEAMTSGAFELYAPDMVIDFGGHVATVKLKAYLRERAGLFGHWSIREDGGVRDGFKSLTDIFHCTPACFFERMADLANLESVNDHIYRDLWRGAIDSIEPPNRGLSNFNVAKCLARRLPKNSILELGILHSVRVMQFYDLDSSITVTANLGALGIDGCLSTAVGMAAGTERDVFIMQGDLSFLYDMNALGIRYSRPNLHVLVVNNGGGAEFCINGVSGTYPDVLDEYLTAGHDLSCEGWATQCGFEYLPVAVEEQLEEAMDRFVGRGARPVLMEVFTDKMSDSEALDRFYAEHSGATHSERVKGTAKDIAKRLASIGFGK